MSKNSKKTLFLAIGMASLLLSGQSIANDAISLNQYAEKNRNVDDLEEQKRILQLQSDIASLRVAEQKAKNDLRIINAETEQKLLDLKKAKEELENPKAKPAEEEEKKRDPFDYISVTRIYGVGSLSATVYQNGAEYKDLKKGDVFDDNYVVKNIDHQGVEISHGGKSKTFRLTSMIRKEERKPDSDPSQGQMAFPMMPVR